MKELCSECGKNPRTVGHICRDCSLKRRKAADEAKKAKGLCIGCSRPTVGGRTQCEICLKSVRDSRKRKAAKGICVNCTRHAIKGKKECKACLKRHLESDRNRHTLRKANRICCLCAKPTIRGKRECEACLKIRRAEFKSRKAEGLCISCGKPNDNGMTQCDACRGYGRTSRERKRSNGICFGCRNRPEPGMAYCRKCNDKSKKIRQSRRSRGLCPKCNRKAVKGMALCRLHRSYGKKMAAMCNRQLKKAAFEKLSGKNPRCAICKTTDNLSVDHIHGDGHLDLMPSGERRHGAPLWRRVLKDPDAKSWARVLCMSCNMKEAGAFNAPGRQTRKPRKPGKSGCIGVSRRTSGRWGATLSANGKHLHLGTFDTKREAIAARKASIKKQEAKQRDR